ncbi:MAG TPA: DUF3099 domain-containing protein [Trebonia sp.]|nr:DUF3099 domain-containing protein [Trebonia sp.]
MKVGHSQDQQVHLVTQARRPMSEDIRYRQHRYLLMMAIRTICLGAALLMFVNHLGWLTAFPAAGAIFIPYIAVVFANGGREPDNVRGFVEYQMSQRKLPAPPEPPTSENGNGGDSPKN